MTRNDRGIDVDSGGNLVVRNDASLNPTNYDIAGATQMPTLNYRVQISFWTALGQTSDISRFVGDPRPGATLLQRLSPGLQLHSAQALGEPKDFQSTIAQQ